MNPATLARRLASVTKASQSDPAAAPQTASADHWPGHFEGALARPVEGRYTAGPLKLPTPAEMPPLPGAGLVPSATPLRPKVSAGEVHEMMRGQSARVVSVE